MLITLADVRKQWVRTTFRTFAVGEPRIVADYNDTRVSIHFFSSAAYGINFPKLSSNGLSIAFRGPTDQTLSLNIWDHGAVVFQEMSVEVSTPFNLTITEVFVVPNAISEIPSLPTEEESILPFRRPELEPEPRKRCYRPTVGYYSQGPGRTGERLPINPNIPGD